jgi:hypothetical protein
MSRLATLISLPSRSNQEAGEEEAVDVCHPQELRARRIEICGQRRDREIEHGEVHRVKEAGKRDHSEADPLTPAGTRNLFRAHTGCG